jgi:hypothetical protein
MSKFNINKLVVLHFYQYIKPTGQRDPLAQLEKVCDGVKLSTCMRVILVLNRDSLAIEQQQVAYENLMGYLDKKDSHSGAIKFQQLEGIGAYEFLLYWMVGGLNPKRTFDDCRIIGDVRGIWNKILTSTNKKAQKLVPIYSNFFNSLFTDTVNLSKLLASYDQLSVHEIADKLHTASSNCAWARAEGFLSCLNHFDYSHFAANTHLKELKWSLELMQNSILHKATRSSTGEVTFFQSAYPISEEQLAGINKRLKTISDLQIGRAHV